jgi:high-affinity iron transporter
MVAAAACTISLAAQPATRGTSGAPASGAAKITNPVKPGPASTAAGKTFYDAQCASCHGTTGKGDGKMAAMMTPPKPSDLTDGTWKHGGTDGEIFAVIRDGAKGTAMRGYAARMKTEDMWNVVNYVRSLGPPARSAR